MARMRLAVNVMVLVVLVVLLAAMAANAEEVLLRHKFVAGQELAYDLWASGVAQMNFSGVGLPAEAEGSEMRGPLSMTMEMNTQYRVPVESVDEQGNATVGLRMGPMGMQMEMMGHKMHSTMDPATGTFEFEVNGEAVELPTQQMAQGWLGLWQGLTATISPRGKVLSISGLPELPAGSMAQMPMLGDFFANLQEMMADIPAWLPEEPVSAGDSWAVQVRFPLPGMAPATPAELKVDYTVERLGEIDGHRVARLGFEHVVGRSY